MYYKNNKNSFSLNEKYFVLATIIYVGISLTLICLNFTRGASKIIIIIEAKTQYLYPH